MSLSIRKGYFSLLLIIIAMLGFGYYLENYDGLNPCPLCLLQRFALIGLGIGCLIGSLLPLRRLSALFLVFINSLFACLGLFFAGRQVWLQFMPHAVTEDCGVSLSYLIDVLPTWEVIKRVMQGSSECAQRQWTFLNLSLAEWTFIAFIIFFIVLMLQCKKIITTQYHY